MVHWFVQVLIKAFCLWFIRRSHGWIGSISSLIIPSNHFIWSLSFLMVHSFIFGPFKFIQSWCAYHWFPWSRSWCLGCGSLDSQSSLQFNCIHDHFNPFINSIQSYHVLFITSIHVHYKSCIIWSNLVNCWLLGQPVDQSQVIIFYSLILVFMHCIKIHHNIIDPFGFYLVLGLVNFLVLPTFGPRNLVHDQVQNLVRPTNGLTSFFHFKHIFNHISIHISNTLLITFHYTFIHNQISSIQNHDSF